MTSPGAHRGGGSRARESAWCLENQTRETCAVLWGPGDIATPPKKQGAWGQPLSMGYSAMSQQVLVPRGWGDGWHLSLVQNAILCNEGREAAAGGKQGSQPLQLPPRGGRQQRGGHVPLAGRRAGVTFPPAPHPGEARRAPAAPAPPPEQSPARCTPGRASGPGSPGCSARAGGERGAQADTSSPAPSVVTNRGANSSV